MDLKYKSDGYGYVMEINYNNQPEINKSRENIKKYKTFNV